MRLPAPFCLLLLAVLPLRASGPGWPQFLGPLRDSHAPDSPPLVESFSGDGPVIAWKCQAGPGFAGPVVTAGPRESARVILFYRQADECFLESRAAVSGDLQWRYRRPTDYTDDFGFDDGPRATPVITGDTVVAYGAEGILSAVSLTDGSLRWERDLHKDYDSGKGFFGRACSPVVVDGMVILSPGSPEAGIAAFDLKSGALKWKTGSMESGYASPVLTTLEATKRVLFFHRGGLAGLDPADGRLCFDTPFRSPMNASVNAATPLLVAPDLVFTTACYDTGAALWRLQPDTSPAAVWQHSDRLDCHYSTPVLVNDCLYGFHGRQESGQELRCIEARTGVVKWSQKLAAGQIIAAGDTLVILTEKGELILAAADPETCTLRTRGQVLSGGHRTSPALADGFLYARDRKNAVCVDLRRPAP